MELEGQCAEVAKIGDVMMYFEMTEEQAEAFRQNKKKP